MQAEKKLNKTREALTEIFLSSLQEERLPWRAGWKQGGMFKKMYNGATGYRYRATNLMILNLEAMKMGYDDPRWCTFNQASERKWKVKKGSKGVPIEFWSIYDKIDGKKVTMDEKKALIDAEERNEEDFNLFSKTYVVFNANCIEGIPELEKADEKKLDNEIVMNGFVERIKENMGVGYVEKGYQPYYSPADDEVVMPEKEKFFNQYEFDSALLHELSHATGHESRLNRKLGKSGTEEYAEEELRAEIASAFISSIVSMEMDEKHIENHKAYIQNWAKAIKDDPNCLFRAIKDAEKISDYLIQLGEIEKVLEIEEEVPQEELEM